jgi:hypothetical protein
MKLEDFLVIRLSHKKFLSVYALSTGPDMSYSAACGEYYNNIFVVL